MAVMAVIILVISISMMISGFVLNKKEVHAQAVDLIIKIGFAGITTSIFYLLVFI